MVYDHIEPSSPFERDMAKSVHLDTAVRILAILSVLELKRL